MSQAKIIWVQDEYNGPMNGLVDYNGEKLWFSRMNNPDIISSTEIPVPFINEESEDETSKIEPERNYILSRISDNDMAAITANHISHCENTGAPLNHGDPIKIKRKTQAVKMPTEVAKTLVPEGQEDIEVELEPRAMVAIKQYDHTIVPGSITGEFVANIKETEFSNYLVPRTFVIVD